MSENGAQNIDGHDPETGRFVAGNIGGGRKPGSRNKLGEQFIADLYAQWQQSGADVLRRVAQDDPVQLMKCVANILPKELDITLSSQIFADARDFAEAYRIAKTHIGAEDQPLIEGHLADYEPDELPEAVGEPGGRD